MNKFGAHAFVWIGAWDTETGNYAIQEAGKEGFDFIEIPLLNPSAFDVASHVTALKQAGITATYSLVLPKDHHMSIYPERARSFLISALDTIQAADGNYLCGCIAYELGFLTGKPPMPQERATVVEVLRDLASEAKRRGITLGLEACNRYETYMYNTLEDARETILAVGADNLKLHGDTYHMNIEEEGFAKPILATSDVLDYMHMSESHRGLVGSGTVNWSQIWDALAQINYQGYLVLESFAAINPDLQAATCLWRPPNQPSQVLAREGLAFLKTGAARALSAKG